MPRKRPAPRRRRPDRAGCFNEAAARCRGKGDQGMENVRHRAHASMRPRPDAAEKADLRPGSRRGTRPASMRPRPDAAEKAGAGVDVGDVANASMRPRPDAAEKVADRRRILVLPRASMRPRPDAAEKMLRRAIEHPPGAASMRPRPDAAEKVLVAAVAPRRPASFNEAAARCRGKVRRGWKTRRGAYYASMRPRPDAAEKSIRPGRERSSRR